MGRWLGRAVFLGALLYVGATVGFPYYQYVMMRVELEEATDIGLAKLAVLRRGPWGEGMVLGEVTAAVTELMQARAKRLGFHLPAHGVRVWLEPDVFRVTTDWEVEPRLTRYDYRFRFHVEGSRVLARW